MSSLRAAALLALRRREAGGPWADSGIPRLEVVTADPDTGGLRTLGSGDRRYTRREWAARVRTSPRGWRGLEVRFVAPREEQEGRMIL
jgi:hypothetical protein